MAVTGIYTKEGQVQFWGSPINPQHLGISYAEDCCTCEVEPVPVTCQIFLDDFGRANIGTNWSQTVGSWAIASGTLYTPSGDARIEFQTPQPSGLPSYIVDVDIKATTDGDCARIWLANDLFVELEVATNGCGYLRLYDSTGEIAETMVEGATPQVWHNLLGCYHYGDGTEIERLTGTFGPLSVGHSGQLFTLERYDISTSSGLYVGLATGDVTGTVYFDNFDYEVYKNDTQTDCADCNLCEIWIPWAAAGSETLSCAWATPSGTWRTQGNSPLYAAYQSSALVVSEVVHSTDHANSLMTCSVDSSTELPEGGGGDICKICHLFNTGFSDSIYIEIKYSTKTGEVFNADGYIKFYDGTTLLDQELNARIYDRLDISMCIEEWGESELFGHTCTFSVHAVVAGGTVEGLYPVTHVDGRRIAFYTNNMEGPFQVYNLEWYRAHSNRDEECDECNEPINCYLCEDTTPNVVAITLAGVEKRPMIDICDNCDLINGTYVLPNTGIDECSWQIPYGILTFPCTDGGSTIYYWFTLFITEAIGGEPVNVPAWILYCDIEGLSYKDWALFDDHLESYPINCYNSYNLEFNYQQVTGISLCSFRNATVQVN